MYQEYPLAQERVKNLLYRVYGWMTIALLLTAGSAYWVASMPQLMIAIWTKPVLMWSLFGIQLIIVILFVHIVQRLSYPSALALFMVYALLSGVTLSSIFWAYDVVSIVQTLIVAGGMFASAAVYGYFTDTDLSQVRSIAVMALWGFVIALIANVFFKSSTFDLMVSAVGVVLFSVLTATDVNMIKQYALRMELENSEDYGKVGLLGALQLYLDFVNLFLSLLSLTGRRKR